MALACALGVVALAATLVVVLISTNKTESSLRASIAAASSSSASSASAAAAQNATFELRGTLTMPLSDTSTDGSSCSGSGGYNDIAIGTSVVVYDQTNAVIATGYLPEGDAGTSCVFHFAVAGVPGTATFYQVEISHRGKITVSAKDAKAGLYAASLGN